MKYFNLAFLVFAILVSLVSLSRAADLEVSRAAVCTAIEDREPVGAADTFDIDVGKVYLSAEVMGADENTPIKHIWYYDGDAVLTVDMTISGPRWRTWSYKNIYESMTGKWRAEITDEQGNVLKSVSFEIK